MEVHDVKIVKRTNDKKKLASYVALMSKYGIANGMSLLPQTPWYSVSFTLKKTSSSMANAFRRVLIEELRTTCLWFDDVNMDTDDEFILADVLQQNIELLPINQDEKNNFDNKLISLYKYNGTADVIDVKASDITVSAAQSNGSTSKAKATNKTSNKTTSKSNKPKVVVNITTGKLIPDSNITITMLRPGKYIRINSMSFLTGCAKHDAGKFTLLDNVSYAILGVKHYDQFTGEGKRSIEYDPTEFRIGFKTSGNITPKQVITLMTTTLTEKLKAAKAYVSDYAKSDQTKQYYYTEGFEVTVSDNIVTYKFHGEYVTLSNLLAHGCYLLDKTILFCTPAVDRLDNEVAIVRLKHADPNTLLISAIDSAIIDVNKVFTSF